MPRKLSEADCLTAVRSGEFSQEIRGSAPSVAVVLTQSWCPQWGFMHGYLADAEATSGERAAIWYVEYDREPFFEAFMQFKEDVFGNRSVPYVRYYRDGALAAESNFISKQGFLSKLGVQ